MFRGKRFTLRALVLATLAAVALTFAAAPASAAPAGTGQPTQTVRPMDYGDCYATADVPWYSSSSGRVYYSGSIHCTNTFPSKITMTTEWYWGNASVQNYHGSITNYCSNSITCYTGAGSYTAYAGGQYYCTVIEAYFNPVGGRVSAKNCTWL